MSYVITSVFEDGSNETVMKYKTKKRALFIIETIIQALLGSGYLVGYDLNHCYVAISTKTRRKMRVQLTRGTHAPAHRRRTVSRL